MENTNIVFIDSNYWIYLFDEATPEHIHVKNHFQEIFDKYQIAINVVVLVEVMHYIVKRLGPNIARSKWNLFSSIDFTCDDLHFQDLENVFNNLANNSHSGIGGRDATILASMEKLFVKHICTHDKSFQSVPNVIVIDPIPE